MTDKKKRELPVKLDMSFEEALERFARADPNEIAASAAAEVLKRRLATDKRIVDARKELEDGARPLEFTTCRSKRV